MLLGLAGWIVLIFLTRLFSSSLTARTTLLALQQLVFTGIGILFVRRKLLKPPGGKMLIRGALYGAGLYFVNSLAGSLSLGAAVRLLGSEAAYRLLMQERAAIEPFLNSDNLWLTSGTVLMLVVGAPLSEELFFRGLVLDSWKDRIGAEKAVFFAALLFAVLHFYLIQFVPVLTAGIFLGIMFVRGENLAVPICAHAVSNALALIAWFFL